ncbi:MAG: Ig-like domain-containing protein, partial [Gemmatimonadetes bacterium]|nr:Ig-like domain-containing protein [Gemmatimonadota bacterium]
MTVAVGEGGGTLRNPPTRTASGPTSVGQWTLGTRSGRNTLIVTVGNLAPATIEATALPGPPAEIRASVGNNQVAPAGDEVEESLGALVVDRFGNPVPQQTVRFDAILGGGSVTPATAVTGADGIASGVRWRLGSRLATQTARAAILPIATDFTARVRSDFTI